MRPYHFVTDEQMHIFERQGKVVELRTYNTVHGAWKYATIEDGQVNLSQNGIRRLLFHLPASVWSCKASLSEASAALA